jgi:hypothetical protein
LPWTVAKPAETGGSAAAHSAEKYRGEAATRSWKLVSQNIPRILDSTDPSFIKIPPSSFHPKGAPHRSQQSRMARPAAYPSDTCCGRVHHLPHRLANPHHPTPIGSTLSSPSSLNPSPTPPSASSSSFPVSSSRSTSRLPMTIHTVQSEPRLTKPLLRGLSVVLDNFDHTRAKGLDRGNVVGEHTHVTGRGGDVDLDDAGGGVERLRASGSARDSCRTRFTAIPNQDWFSSPPNETRGISRGWRGNVIVIPRGHRTHLVGEHQTQRELSVRNVGVGPPGHTESGRLAGQSAERGETEGGHGAGAGQRDPRSERKG